MNLALALTVGLVPVVLFLTALRWMDSYRLVSRNETLRTILIGGLSAGAAWLVNRTALEGLGLDPLILRRYVAPLVEETLKATYVVYLVRSAKVGFMVDAGIHGFALGVGFALVENVYYAATMRDFHPLLWIVRGLGTAVMHSAATAIVAIRSKDLADRHESGAWRWFLPGLLVAVVVHSFFNHLVWNPLITTALLLLVMPLLLIVVFERSERDTREWLGTGMDSDMELLELILSGEIVDTRVGHYLESLKSRFPGGVVADMLCLLRIHLELSVRAKGFLLARAAGVSIPGDEDVRANLEEMRYLERAIGPTGQIALLPLRKTSSRDLWQVYAVQQS